MSTDTTYTSDTNSPRWPLYAIALFALICCTVMWRSCHFSGQDPGAPPAAAAPAK